MAMQRSLSFDNQWEQTVNDINHLVQTHVHKQSVVDRYQDKDHWSASFSAKQCANEMCQTRFGLFDGPRKCQRCNGLFCKQCTSYERRLNSSGNFDPGGRSRKVCKCCFGLSYQSLGVTVTHFSCFLRMRSDSRVRRNSSIIKHGSTLSRAIHRDSVNFEQECKRLRDGFLSSLQALKVGQTISDMFGVSKPEWEKSSALLYGKMAERCYGCQCQFGFLQRRHNCVICGALVCEKCSSRDLIVYIPDDDVAMGTVSAAAVSKLAIIKIFGCPEMEPNYCRYLRVCVTCNGQVQSRQISDFEAASCQSAVDEVSQMWLSLDQVHEKLRKLQVEINGNLPKYLELLELLDIGTRQTSACPKNKNNMQILAKSQCDLSDHFSKFITTISGVKHLKPVTSGQMKVLRNIILSNVEYYHEHMAEFRSLQHQLETVVPPESLMIIQNCVDKNAINSCYISIKQLIFEVIHICQKHHLEAVTVSKLLPLEEAARRDLQSCVEDSWEDHAATIEDLLRYQLENHRLVRVPSASDKTSVMTFIAQRIQSIVEKILYQLMTKASYGKFQETKSLLTELADV